MLTDLNSTQIKLELIYRVRDDKYNIIMNEDDDRQWNEWKELIGNIAKDLQYCYDSNFDYDDVIESTDIVTYRVEETTPNIIFEM